MNILKFCYCSRVIVTVGQTPKHQARNLMNECSYQYIWLIKRVTRFFFNKVVFLSFHMLTNYASYFELVYLYKTEEHLRTDFYQVETKFTDRIER